MNQKELQATAIPAKRYKPEMVNKAVYLALGVNREGRELLGLWLPEEWGWLNVLTELQNRGVKDILITCVDGFPDEINTVFPHRPRFNSVLSIWSVTQ